MTGDDNHDSDRPETTNPSQPIPPPTSQLPHAVSSIKLPILKKGEYDIWVMKMEHYLCLSNMAKKRERKARTTLLMALPKDHLTKFHKMADAKEMWEAIKSRFGGNDESKKMQKYLLKQQFEGFYASSSEGFHKCTNDVSTAYNVSSSSVLKSQKEGSASYTDEVIHSFLANQSSALQLDCDDLEQINDDDLKEMDLKWQVAIISMRIKKFHKRTGRKLQFDTRDTVGFDKTKLECFNFHKIGHFARDCKAKGNQDSRRRNGGYNGNKARDNGRIPAYQDDLKALVTIDGEAIDWSAHVEEDTQNFAMMAYSSSNSGSDNEVQYCSKTRSESYARLKKLYDEQRDELGDASVEITAYTLALKKTLVDELDAKTSKNATCESDSSFKTTTSMLAAVDNVPKIVCEPKVWTYAPIIEEYESDSDDDLVFNVQEDKEKPSFAFTNSVKHVKSPRENIKKTGIPNHYPKIEKQDRHSHTRKVNAARQNLSRQAALSSTASKVNTARPFVNDTRPKICFYKSHSPNKSAVKRNRDTAVKAPAGNNGRITGKEKIKAGRLDFEDIYYVEELKNYNLFSVSQMYDKKNKVLPTDTDCIVMSPDFKLPDENQVLLKIPRQHNMYSFNLKNIDPSGDLSCLFSKALIDESNKWHKRLGHVNFKNLNKLVKGNLVRGLPSKIFENDYTCVACQKGKQHKASWIKREYSNARTPQQNGVAERKNMTLIKAAKTLLAYLFLPTTFWAEAVNTACYVLNRALVTKPQNKTPYELLTGRQPIISYLRPFGCHVTILNAIDQLGKFDGKSDSEFVVGYSLNSKAFKVYNLETKRVEENMHVNFLENKPNVAGKRHAWMFDLDYLTNSMNYEPVSLENQANKSVGPKEANHNVGTEANDDQDVNSKEIDLHDEHFVLPEELEKLKRQEKEANDAARKEATHENQDANTNSTNLLNAVSTLVSVVGLSRALHNDEPSYPDNPSMPHLEDIYASLSKGIFIDSSYDDEGVVTNFNNLETTVNVSLTPTTRIHTIHPKLKFLEILSQLFRQKVKCIRILRLILLLPFGKKAIRTEWVYRNKKNEMRVVVRNKVRLVAQGHRQEEGIDYDEVFAHVAMIEAIRIFLAFDSYMGFIVYQMDVKSAFLYGTIDEEVYVTQQPGFAHHNFPNKVYKVVKALYGLHQAHRACVKTASTPIETQKPLVKDEEAADVNVNLYRDAHEKKLIHVLKIHTDDNVADLLTKAFDVRVNTPRCDEDSLKLKELMVFFVQFVLRKMELELLLVKTINDEVRVQALIDAKRVAIKESFIRRTLKLDDEEGTSCLANDEIFTGLANMGYEKIYDKLTFYKAFFSPKWKFLIHTILQCLSAKTTSWNEFSSTMASTIICLATNQKFNFSRYILLSLVKNIEAGVPFYMFPKFMQLIVDYQLGDMSHHQDIYDNPSLTKKVFANMKRVAQAQDDVSIPTEPSIFKPHKKHKLKKQQPIAPKVPSPEPSPEHQLPLPSNDSIPDADKDSLKLQELVNLCTRLSNKVLDLKSGVIEIKSSFIDKIGNLEDKVHKLEEENQILKEKSVKSAKIDTAAPVEEKEESFKQGRMIADMDEDVEDINEEEPAEVEEVLKVVKAAKLFTKVVTTVEPTTTTAAQVPKASAPRRRRGVVIQDPKETAASVIVHTKVQPKDKEKGILIEEPKPLKRQAQIEQDEAFVRQLEAELNVNINWNDVIEQVEKNERQNNKVMRYQALKRKPLTETQARKNMMIYLKNMAGFKMNLFKVMTYSEIRPLFEKHYNSIQAFLEKVEEEVTVQEKEIKKEGSKRQCESLKQEIVKKQRIDEEAEDLKRHLQIVATDDDDVYTKATPLASKVPVVDYQIHYENNKPYYKIIRVDGTHKLFLSFITLLKNFDREDLETLWKLVKERFETKEPKNFSDDFLLNITKIMFEKHNIEANIWKDQKGRYGLAKVKSWKLFESYGVHIITLKTTQMFLLVEKKYPLTHFTVEQMLNNVRLKVKEESKMSLKLLRLVRRQLNEGYVAE
nr:hypothetical protein [Tanacetum cinerariifolium]